VIAGDVDGETALDRLATIASPRTTADRDTPDPLPSAAAIGIDPAEGLRTVHVAHATQTEIRVGHASVGRDSEDLPALDVLGTILGGGPTSRLARRLRQQAGLTYHVRSRFIGRRLGGMFVVETRVAHDATARALAGIREEIARLCEERVSGAEIEQARQSLFLAERRRFQDLIGTGSTLGAMALRGDPVRQLERTARAMAAVEPESLRELAGRCLKPGGLVAVVAGPEAPH
jgi:zinc protease